MVVETRHALSQISNVQICPVLNVQGIPCRIGSYLNLVYYYRVKGFQLILGAFFWLNPMLQLLI